MGRKKTLSTQPCPVNTIGQIARLLNVQPRRVAYVVATRPHIKPRATAGNARIFDNAAVAAIRHEVNAMDARREAART